MPKKKEFEPCAFAVFPKLIGVTENFCNALHHRNDLVPANKGIEASAQMRVGGEASSHAQRKADFGTRPGAAAGGG